MHVGVLFEMLQMDAVQQQGTWLQAAFIVAPC